MRSFTQLFSQFKKGQIQANNSDMNKCLPKFRHYISPENAELLGFYVAQTLLLKENEFCEQMIVNLLKDAGFTKKFDPNEFTDIGILFCSGLHLGGFLNDSSLDLGLKQKCLKLSLYQIQEKEMESVGQFSCDQLLDIIRGNNDNNPINLPDEAFLAQIALQYSKICQYGGYDAVYENPIDFVCFQPEDELICIEKDEINKDLIQTIAIIGQQPMSLQQLKYQLLVEHYCMKIEWLEAFVYLSINCDIDTQRTIVRSKIDQKVCNALLKAHTQIDMHLNEDDIQILWEQSKEWRTIDDLNYFSHAIFELNCKRLITPLSQEWLRSKDIKDSQIIKYMTNQYNIFFTPIILQLICEQKQYDQFLIILEQIFEIGDIQSINPNKVSPQDQRNIEEIIMQTQSKINIVTLINQLFKLIQFDIVKLINELMHNKILLSKEQLSKLSHSIKIYLRINEDAIEQLKEINDVSIFIWCLALCDHKIRNCVIIIAESVLFDQLLKLQESDLSKEYMIDILHAICIGQSNYIKRCEYKQQNVYYNLKIQQVVSQLNDQSLLQFLYFKLPNESIVIPQYATINAVNIIMKQKNNIQELYQIVNNSHLQFDNEFMHSLSIQNCLLICSIIQSDIVNTSILERIHQFTKQNWLQLLNLTPCSKNSTLHYGGYQKSGEEIFIEQTKSFTLLTSFALQDEEDQILFSVNLQDCSITLQQVSSEMYLIIQGSKQKDEYSINIQALMLDDSYNQLSLIIDCKNSLGLTLIVNEYVCFSGIYPIKNQLVQSFSFGEQNALFKFVRYAGYCLPLSVMRLEVENMEQFDISKQDEFTFASSAVPYSLYLLNKQKDYQNATQIDKCVVLEPNTIYTNVKCIKEIMGIYDEAILSTQNIKINADKKTITEKINSVINNTSGIEIMFKKEKITHIIQKQTQYSISNQEIQIVELDLTDKKLSVSMNNVNFEHVPSVAQKIQIDPFSLLERVENINFEASKPQMIKLITSSILNSKYSEEIKVLLLQKMIQIFQKQLDLCVQTISEIDIEYLHLLQATTNQNLIYSIVSTLLSQIQSIESISELEAVLLTFTKYQTLDQLLIHLITIKEDNADLISLIQIVIFIYGKPNQYQYLIQNLQSNLICDLLEQYYEKPINILDKISPKVTSQYIYQTILESRNLMIDECIIQISKFIDLPTLKLLIKIMKLDQTNQQEFTIIFNSLQLQLQINSKLNDFDQNQISNALDYLESSNEFLQLQLIFQHYSPSYQIKPMQNIILSVVPYEAQISLSYFNSCNNYTVTPIQSMINKSQSLIMQNSRITEIYLDNFEHGFKYSAIDKEQHKLSYTPYDLCLLQQIISLNTKQDSIIQVVANHFTELLSISNNVNKVPHQYFSLLYSYNQNDETNSLVLLQILKRFIQDDMNLSILDKRSNFTSLHKDLDLCQVKNLAFFSSIYRYVWIQITKNLRNNKQNPDLEHYFILLTQKIGLKYIVVRKLFSLMLVIVSQVIPFSDFSHQLLELSLTFDWQQEKKWIQAIKTCNRYKYVLNDILQNYQDMDLRISPSTSQQKSSYKQDISSIAESDITEESADKEIDFEIFIFIAAIWSLYFAQQNNEQSNQIIDMYIKAFMNGNATKLLLQPFSKYSQTEIQDSEKFYKLIHIISKVWIQLGASLVQSEQLYQAQIYSSLSNQINFNLDLQKPKIQQFDQTIINKRISQILNNKQYYNFKLSNNNKTIMTIKSFQTVDNCYPIIQQILGSQEDNQEDNQMPQQLEELLLTRTEQIVKIFNIVIQDQSLNCPEGLLIVTTEHIIIVPGLQYEHSLFQLSLNECPFSAYNCDDLEKQNKVNIVKLIQQPCAHSQKMKLEQQIRDEAELQLEYVKFERQFVKYIPLHQVTNINRIQLNGVPDSINVETEQKINFVFNICNYQNSWNSYIRALQRINNTLKVDISMTNINLVPSLEMCSVGRREMLIMMLLSLCKKASSEIGPIDFLNYKIPKLPQTKQLNEQQQVIQEVITNIVPNNVLYHVRLIRQLYSEFASKVYDDQSVELTPFSKKGITFMSSFPVLESGDIKRPQLPQANSFSEWYALNQTNFQLLSELNMRAGRTDLSLQNYPIFPWILNNRDLQYPPSAQSEQVRASLQNKYAESNMFHLATLPSSAASVIYFNLRMQPFEFSLRQLQSGSYDAPDRMFRSLQIAWNVVTDPGVGSARELVRDLFQMPVFLNVNGFEFGELQNGSGRVDDVIEEPIIEQMKLVQMINGAEVQKQMHMWINQLFGNQQKNESKCNIYPMQNYQEDADFDSVCGFGIIPKKVVGDLEENKAEHTGNIATIMKKQECDIQRAEIEKNHEGNCVYIDEDMHTFQYNVKYTQTSEEYTIVVLQNDEIHVFVKGQPRNSFFPEDFVDAIHLHSAMCYVLSKYSLTFYNIILQTKLFEINLQTQFEQIGELESNPTYYIQTVTDQNYISVQIGKKVLLLSHCGLIVASHVLDSSNKALFVQQNEDIILISFCSDTITLHKLVLSGLTMKQTMGIDEFDYQEKQYPDFSSIHPHLKPFQIIEQNKYKFIHKNTQICSFEYVSKIVCDHRLHSIEVCEGSIYSVK
ncbi:Lipopolysaccharide-responsive_and beige-like anchor protein [Hexamita inflata]|uniref:Lipopolysaccharide-responsive and beige-like anchor protein n=1 Tax=Hexamita inflata TaxID=28002 RepID=A0AA86UFX4_9EUKA|nr:Lipopolysaccharide-responsive and beige-like anchor protein [Hexamita inflata]